ncbi:uncharacterized protein LOC113492748 [Trichoplusia ni]|uniref:Uncharacterized protein LOC113492748 n=1 Tax=Trichoplusia ni TaxID=7111 RepID=A0A7E5VD44_TRINI|nr:uncharacterized protein LOC113492748 [Trichoplusia ni]
MHYVYVIVLTCLLAPKTVTFGADVLPKTCAEKQVLNFLTEWREGVELPVTLPSLDVIQITSFENVYQGFGIKISYVTGDMKLEGVRNFTVQQLSLSSDYTRASATVRFPLLRLTSDNYTLKGRAYLLYPLSGAGFMNVTFQNVDVTVGITFVSKGGITQAGEINLNLTIGDVKINLANSSWPLNQVLSLRRMEIIEEYRSTFISASKDYLKFELDRVLGNTTTVDTIRTIANNYCKLTANN